MAHSVDWMIRHAGRESGPFDVERLRVLARRGALTKFHQLSRGGNPWTPATQVREVFNEDGTVVPGAAGSDEPPMFSPHEDDTTGADETPLASRTRAVAWSGIASHVTVRSAQIAALTVTMAALAVPTGRTATGAPEWWFAGSALDIAVHALCGVVLLAWWIVVFMPPNPAQGSAFAAISAVLAAAVVLPLQPWAPYAIPAGLVLPLAALLVACESHRAPQVRGAGVVMAVVAGLGVPASAYLLYLNQSTWGAVCVSMYTLGAAGLVTAGIRGATERTVFVPTVLGSIGAAGALFAAAIGGLEGTQPMHAAGAAVAGLLALGLSVLTWSGAHQALHPAAAPPINHSDTSL
jgi:hypothetical protein